MKALVLADTHLRAETLDRMPAEVSDLADEADVVLHAGDVVDPAVLTALGERATVHAVLATTTTRWATGCPTCSTSSSAACALG